MTDAERTFVDTNVLVYATEARAPLHQEARNALDKLTDDGAELWISTQVIREYMVNMTRVQSYREPVAMSQVLRQIERFRAEFKVAEETTAVLDWVLILAEQSPLRGKQIHDINIVATMLTYHIPSLLTHNEDDFKAFSAQVRIIPLRPGT